MRPAQELDIPDGWPTPAAGGDDVVDRAFAVTREALSDATTAPATSRLAAYYDPARRWAGVSFLELQPVEPSTITAADLHALTVLNAPVGALPTRQLLDDGPQRTEVVAALAGIHVEADLAHADRQLLAAMEELWQAVYRACQDPWFDDSNPWVTAAKVCARKRPGLFPIRDSVVCEGLGLYDTPARRRGDRRVDWQVFAHLISDSEISIAIDELSARVHDQHGVRCDQWRLRTLDAALWTWLRRS